MNKFSVKKIYYDEDDPVEMFPKWLSILFILSIVAVSFFVGTILMSLNELKNVFQEQPSVYNIKTKVREVLAKEKTPLLESEFYTIVEESLRTTTAYNTVASQTDGNPCISADGSNVCGRIDTIACPKQYKFGTLMLIGSRIFECTDRTASKYGDRVDINFDKNVDGALQWGKKKVLVRVLDKQ